MELYIDDVQVKAKQNKSFQELIASAGLDTNDFTKRPLAVMAGGMLCSLDRVPYKRVPALDGQDRPLIRALAGAGGHISTLTVSDITGYDVYVRSLWFLVLAAFSHLYPDAELYADYSILGARFFSVHPDTLRTKETLKAVKEECRRIVEADMKIVKKRLFIDDAIDVCAHARLFDSVELLSWRTLPYFDLHYMEGGNYTDCLYGEMVPSTSYLKVFDIAMDGDRFALLPPDQKDPNVTLKLPKSKKLAAAFKKNTEWDRLMHCMTISDLNSCVESGSIRELIRVNEALHEKDYSRIADSIVHRGAHAVLLAGPSSSGKTTSANRICTQLRVLGKMPCPISLDNYYKDRDKCVVGPDGKVDLEHINCLDIDRFREDLQNIIRGNEVTLPKFDFTSQKSDPKGGITIHPSPNTVLVIEGLHGLNPDLLPPTADRGEVFKVYVSALSTMNLDSHNRIRSTWLRMLRRMVRDYHTRNSSITNTFSVWDSVRKGEERWIFPYQEEADAVFNSALVYEPAVVKKYIYPLLMNIHPDNPYYEDARDIIRFLNYILDATVEDEIPPTSVLREFIGGNTFYTKER